jgi:hypothetical protein
MNQEVEMLPEIPKGYRLLETNEEVLPGDLWSFYSSLAIHSWQPAKHVNQEQLEYNRYIRKID